MSQNFRVRFTTNIVISLGSIIVILAIVLYLGFDIADKSNFISESQSKLLSLVDGATNVARLSEQEKTAAASFAKLNNALPKRDSLFSVSRDLGSLARQNGLSFGSKFGEEIPATETKPGLIKIEMVAQGGDRDLIQFVKNLEDSNYFINIINLDIIRQGARFSSIINAQVFFNK
ncbi:MAG: hypothetical protein HYR95_01970 [Candidatus Colwellbacteria bacterium]|nr:hypothetical protein [Candidatus Colwellbacteria bacterium]